ncbi:ABC transporter ATP-binding protein [Streptomyces sp. 8N706]|uniref:ABC transporter ATP-binding protein n=1 Tax=Streptomyces sp. 8N706 TaxID=3457416 RepID=UPI003FCF480E
MKWLRRRPADERGAEESSESERLLFGGPLRYDLGWSRHEDAFLHLNLAGMVLRLPHLLATTARLAWRADRRALRTVALAEIGRGVAQAIGLVAVNRVLAELLGDGPTADRLREAAPALVVVAVVALSGALLRSASTAGTGRLEPKVERVATEVYLERTARVELSAIEDDTFHKLLDSAQYGAMSARRMIKYCTSVIKALLSLTAAAGVLAVLHPLLLPLLVAMTLPSAWAALSIARRRYRSYHAWVQHSRAGQLISRLLISTDAAPEVRVHHLGPFLLEHFRGMSESSEEEQTRLARLAARTSLIAAVWSGIAALATYATLGGLLWTGAMALSVAGTAVIAIRTGASSLDDLVLQINYLHEESLFVGDLDRLCEEAERRAIPTGGVPLPERPGHIHVEDVSFTYPGTDNEPALHHISLSIPMGRIVALVGENGSGKTTLIKLLCGLYAPDEGRILWDGTDTADVDRQELCSRIAVVGQDFHHWPFTAKVNVAIGRPEVPITEERLETAARYAGADEVIAGLPRGWGTLLARGYRGGHQLSGGQWQRLGIARARYRDAEILVVDEPTSALDAKAEQQVFEQIRSLADSGQTVILITHRLGSVRHADMIHVLADGRLAESGTFTSLMADDAEGPGIFRDLYRIQSDQYRLDRPTVPVQNTRVARTDPTATDPTATGP